MDLKVEIQETLPANKLERAAEVPEALVEMLQAILHQVIDSLEMVEQE